MGDWVVGLTPKQDNNGIVFLMRVDETPKTYTEYWHDKRFKAKRPSYDGGVLSKCGDRVPGIVNSGLCINLRTCRMTSEENMS